MDDYVLGQCLRIIEHIERESNSQVKVLSFLSRTLVVFGRLDEAKEVVSKAISMLDKINDHYYKATRSVDIALTLASLGKTIDAEKMLNKAVDVVDQIEYDSRSYILSLIAKAFFIIGKFYDAEKMLNKAIEIDNVIIDYGYPPNIRIYVEIANMLARSGKFDYAEKIIDKSIELSEKRYRRRGISYELWEALAGLVEYSVIQASFGELEVAQRAVDRAIKIADRITNVPDSSDRWEPMWITLSEFVDYIETLVGIGKLEDAESILTKVMKIVDDAQDKRVKPGGYAEIARALMAIGRINDAEKYLNNAIRMTERCESDFLRLKASYRITKATEEIAESLIENGRVEDATKLMQRILQLAKGLPEENSRSHALRNIITHLKRIINLMIDFGRHDIAEEVLNKLIKIADSIRDTYIKPIAYIDVALALADMNKFSDAKKLVDEAIDTVNSSYTMSRILDEIILHRLSKIKIRFSSTEFVAGVENELMLKIEATDPINDCLLVMIKGLDIKPFTIRSLGFHEVRARVKLKENETKTIKVKISPQTLEELNLGGAFEKRLKIVGKLMDRQKKDASVLINELDREHEMFAHYEFIEKIGEGGFANVYKAKRRDGKIVAVKVFKGGDKKAERAFIEEIGSFVRISKSIKEIPYIVVPIDYGILPKPYVATELYPGTLRGLIGKDVEFKKKIKLLLRMAWALSLAHSQGVYHGDLKPENILVKEEGGEYYPAIADWGGGFTPCYSAPEVHESEGKQVTNKSDVWSFGVIMYELLTGTRLFKDPFDYVGRIGGDIRVDFYVGELKDLMNSCLLRDPAKRPPMTYVCDCLEKYLTNYLQSSISKKITADVAVDLISMYLMRGDFEGARRGLRVSGSGGIVPASILILLEKLLRIYEVIHEYHGKIIPTEKIETAWRNMLDYLDKDLRDKLANDKYSLEMYLALKDGIPPELHDGLRISLERAVNIVISHYLSKQAVVRQG